MFPPLRILTSAHQGINVRKNFTNRGAKQMRTKKGNRLLGGPYSDYWSYVWAMAPFVTVHTF